MKRIAAIAVGPLLLMITAAYAQNEQGKATDKTPNRAQLLTTGRITNIDAKKRVLTVRTDSTSSGLPRQPQGSGRTGSRSGGSTGGRRRRVGFPGSGPIPGDGGGRSPKPAQIDNGKEFKVAVTDQTSIKGGDNGETRMSFLNLNVSDHITIQGLPTKGDNLEATQITLLSR